ncbi:MAG: hypothetical protein RL689_1300 [Planctomycetota bacterium]
MQLRLAAAYPSPSTPGAVKGSGDSAGEPPAARADVVDRLDLSPTAKMQQRIRDSLLAGRVDRSILADEPTAGEARATLSAIAMHRSAAAANAAATGVAAGATFDATA